MAKRRLNDTAALVGIGYGSTSVTSDGPESVSVSARKIENGYLVERCKSTGNSYETSTEFHKTKPELVMEQSRAAPEPGNNPSPDGSMRKAVEWLMRDGPGG